MINIRSYNREVWNHKVEQEDEWTIPFDSEVIAAARSGKWDVLLTPTKPVPRSWFPDLKGLDLLCLASGGGQQGPIFAAAGANVTVLDNSPRQLQQDRYVADRDFLSLATVEGDMRDLSMFADASFDLVFHPVANLFIPDVRPVWKEAYRVLKKGGALLSGFMNPVSFLFDNALLEHGVLVVKYPLPYSDMTSITEAERQLYMDNGGALEFGHTLDDQIGGQLDSGFLIAGFYEDSSADRPIEKYTSTFIATRAVKM